MEEPSNEEYQFTCITCSLAFSTSHVQRQHFASDLHRYNAKRRVVKLPPVSAQVYNEKVLQHRANESQQQQNGEASAESKLSCKVCNKSFNTENAQENHLKSKKHKEMLVRGEKPSTTNSSSATKRPQAPPKPNLPTELPKTEEEMTKLIEETIPPLEPLECLFCHPGVHFTDEDALVQHMHHDHGFILPDNEYLVDRTGLLQELASRIGTWSTCLYCGTAFGGRIDEPQRRRGLEATRKHMTDKYHCRLPWDTENQRLEYSDYYDYSTSYPAAPSDDGDSEWEDDEDGSSSDIDIDDFENDGQLRYGDTSYELVLPSGAKIGHRALQRIYRQNLVPYLNEPNTKQNRKLISNGTNPQGTEHLGLIPVSRTGELVKARNRGEARHATKSVREYWDNRKREQFRSRVAIKVHNNQKHFRDPLLQ